VVTAIVVGLQSPAWWRMQADPVRRFGSVPNGPSALARSSCGAMSMMIPRTVEAPSS
jgi:hypothetical protein